MALFGVTDLAAILHAMQIRHVQGLAGAATAHAATVVIDVFRAFSAAAYAFAAGAPEIVLVEDVYEAVATAERFPGSILMGEVDGTKPTEFDLGNSPGEIVAQPELVRGRTIIHRSSAGTRSARTALGNGAHPLYVASLVVASATAAALAGESTVTLVSSGLSGTLPAEEDDLCADVIARLLRGDKTGLERVGPTTATTERAQYLREATFAHPDDVRLCCDTDRFDFAMRAEEIEDLVRVSAIQ